MQAYSVWPTVTLDAADLLAASDIEERHRLAFRDAMIVAAARKSGASLLIADRIEPFRPITGLDVKNPFA
jgi:predicted nucleic acid-binding protein